MIKCEVWRFSKYSVYFCVFKFRVKILILGNCNLKKILQLIWFSIQLLKQSTINPIFTVNFQLMSICFGLPITHSLTLNQTSLSIFILKSLKPIHRTNKKKRKKKEKNVSRGTQGKKKQRSFRRHRPRRVARKPKWGWEGGWSDRVVSRGLVRVWSKTWVVAGLRPVRGENRSGWKGG